MKRRQKTLSIWIVCNICAALFASLVLMMGTWLHYLPMHTSSTAYEPVPAMADAIIWDIVGVVMPWLAVIGIVGGGVYLFNYFLLNEFSSRRRNRFCLSLAVIWWLILLFGLMYSSFAYYQKHAPFFY